MGRIQRLNDELSFFGKALAGFGNEAGFGPFGNRGEGKD